MNEVYGISVVRMNEVYGISVVRMNEVYWLLAALIALFAAPILNGWKQKGKGAAPGVCPEINNVLFLKSAATF